MTAVKRVKEWRKIKNKKKSAYYRYKRIIDNIQGLTILDVGTGNGYLTYELSKKFNVTTIDLSKKAVESLSDTLSSLGLKAELINDDFLKYKFNKRYDTVIISEFIEHFNEFNAKKVIKKAYKLAKKAVVITTPNKDLVKKSDKTHIKEYTLGEFRDLLTNYYPLIHGAVINGYSPKEAYDLARDKPQDSRTLVAVILKEVKPERRGYYDLIMDEVINYYKSLEPKVNPYLFNKGRIIRLITFQRFVESLSRRVDLRGKHFVRRKTFTKLISSAKGWSDIYNIMRERCSFDLNISTSAYKYVKQASLLKKTYCQVKSGDYYTYFNCALCRKKKCKTNLITRDSFAFIDIDLNPETIINDYKNIKAKLDGCGIHCAYKFSSDSGIHLKIPLSTFGIKKQITVFDKAVIQYCAGMLIKKVLMPLKVKVDDAIFLDPNQSVRMPFALHYKKILPSIPFNDKTVNEAFRIINQVKAEQKPIERVRTALRLVSSIKTEWEVKNSNKSFFNKAKELFWDEAVEKLLRRRKIKPEPTTPSWVRKALKNNESTPELIQYFKNKGLSRDKIKNILKSVNK